MNFKSLFVILLFAIGGYMVYKSFLKEEEAPVTISISAPKPQATGLEMIQLSKTQPYWKWTDSEGVIHFTNDAASIPKRYRSGAKFINDEGDLSQPEKPDWGEKETVTRALSLKLYCSKKVLACQYMERLLEKEDVKYTYQDVELDQQARAELISLMRGKQEVPVLQYPGGYFVGYKPEELKALLQNLLRSR